MARRLPSLNAIRAFEAAARHASFTAAAEELFVTHAAVSRHVRDLEKWLGQDLFVRTRRGVRLTEAGLRYSARITPLFDALAGATHEAMAGEPCRLVVTVEPAFASRWLVPRLGKFAAAYPDIELKVDPDVALADFRSGAADVGLRYGIGPWDDVEALGLVQSVSFPVCSRALLEHPNAIRPEALAGYRLLHEQHKLHWREWLTRAGVMMGDDWRGVIFQAQLAIEAAEAGQGFALGDQMLCTDALAEGRLVRPFSLDIEDPGQYFLVWAKGATPSAPMLAFRDWLKAEVDKTQSLFEEMRAGEGRRASRTLLDSAKT